MSFLQVRLCREKKTGQVYAMKKLKKSEMLRRGQVALSPLGFVCEGLHCDSYVHLISFPIWLNVYDLLFFWNLAG